MKKKPNETESLGQQIARMRIAAGLTHQALADAAGIARQTVRLIESHPTPYGTTVETMLRLCRVLGADPCEVLRRLPVVKIPADETAGMSETPKPARRPAKKSN